jgi:hypothetical protein
MSVDKSMSYVTAWFIEVGSGGGGGGMVTAFLFGSSCSSWCLLRAGSRGSGDLL